MQKTVIVRGKYSRVDGKTVADAVNEMLEKSTDFRLTQTTVLKAGTLDCTLLCVFEKNDLAIPGSGEAG